ncbi:MAG: germination protein [Clostridia bacterium]|nr:germination protein [Clostridia bacterium]MDN5321834.1 germination protein [Clostridia bacterium]
MKRLIAVVLVLILVVGITGCSSKGEKEQITPVDISTREIVQMPDYIQDHLEELKLKETYQAFKLDGGLLLFAARGEMPTGGYTISFGKAGIKNGKLLVEVNTSDPKNDKMVTEALTYPVALAKVIGKGLPDKVVFVKGSEYNKIIKEVEVTEIPQPEESVVTLYFGTKDGYLRREPRSISGLPTAERGKELIEELIKGTQANDDTLNVLPEGTKVLGYKFDAEKGLITLDLSEHVQGVAGSMGETLAVYSIVNTLTELPGVERVKILVEGKEVETIGGHIYLGDPLTRDLELLEGNILK